MANYKGSGDTLGYLGDIEIKDDGDNDTHVYFITPGGKKDRRLKNLRKHLGEGNFKDMISSDDSPSVNSGSFEQSEPVAFSCRGCHRTFPRTMKEGDNYCPDCS